MPDARVIPFDPDGQRRRAAAADTPTEPIPDTRSRLDGLGLGGHPDQVASDLERRAAGALAFLRRRISGDYRIDEFGFDLDLTERTFRYYSVLGLLIREGKVERKHSPPRHVAKA